MTTVLVAEDDADIRMLITLKLTQAGHQVRSFGDGLSAAADAREHLPDLAVLDVMMPGMSGLEVCQELRQDPATARVPVILLTAMAREADIAAGLAVGADDYIVKPFSPREFTMRINAVLARVQAGNSRPLELNVSTHGHDAVLGQVEASHRALGRARQQEEQPLAPLAHAGIVT
jgi:two-component system response regulator MtrA